MRTDTGSRTIEDAAAFERAHNEHAYGDDRPSASDLAYDAYWDEFNARRQRERDDAARARGEYVPTSAMRSQASMLSMSLAQRGVFNVEVAPSREGVLSIVPTRGHGTSTPEQVIEATRDVYSRPGYSADVVMGDRCVWVRIDRTPFGDPFLDTEGLAQDGPPF